MDTNPFTLRNDVATIDDAVIEDPVMTLNVSLLTMREDRTKVDTLWLVAFNVDTVSVEAN